MPCTVWSFPGPKFDRSTIPTAPWKINQNVKTECSTLKQMYTSIEFIYQETTGCLERPGYTDLKNKKRCATSPEVNIRKIKLTWNFSSCSHLCNIQHNLPMSIYLLQDDQTVLVWAPTGALGPPGANLRGRKWSGIMASPLKNMNVNWDD